ncbi:MAG: LysR family transcriptional regulator, partial [Microcystis sp.]
MVLLDEIYQELCKNQLVLNYLRGVRIIESYQELLDSVQKSHKSTILPDFCQFNSLLNYPTSIIPIQDVNEYGVYLHVPHFSELLILGESLVRSFRIDQDDLAISPQPNLIFASDTLPTKNIL